MISVMIYQRLCATKRLFNFDVNHKILQTLNTNICTLNSVKKEPILKNKYHFYISKRNFFYRFFRRDTPDKLRIKDDVPDDYILIYRSRMDRYILCGQITSTVCALVGFISGVIKYDITDFKLDSSQLNTTALADNSEILVYMASFITIIAILQVMASKLPVRIYNLPQQKKYILVFLGNFPFTQRKLICKTKDIVHLPETGILPWREARFLIDNKHKVILMEHYFRRPADLYIWLGVQRDPNEEDEE